MRFRSEPPRRKAIRARSQQFVAPVPAILSYPRPPLIGLFPVPSPDTGLSPDNVPFLGACPSPHIAPSLHAGLCLHARVCPEAEPFPDAARCLDAAFFPEARGL